MKNKINWVIFMVILIFIIMYPFYYQNKISVKSENTKNISLILKNQNDDYWRNVQLGAEVAANEFNIKLNIIAPEDGIDTLGQEDLINEAVERNVDALLLAPSSFDDLVKPVENAVDKGIPVLTLDSRVNTEKVSCCIATDNLSAGKSAGEKLVRLAGTNSVVAIIGFNKNTGSNDLDRYTGLKYITDKFQGIQVITGSEDIKDLNGAEWVTKELLLKNKKISAVVALNYEASIGAARAIEKLGLRGKIIVVAFDGDPQEIDYMESGTIQSVVIQSPFSMGYLGVKNAVLMLQGENIPKSIESGFTVIDKEDIYLPENQKILFPFTQ
jgi:ribose transport system substrate-binding protein